MLHLPLHLLFLLAADGTDSIFHSANVRNAPAPRIQEVLGQNLLSAPAPFSSRDEDGSRLWQQLPDIPAQSMSAPPSIPIQKLPETGVLQTVAGEFVEGMNPFAKLQLRTVSDYYDPYGWQGSYGTSGHQPWRLGWVSYNDLTILPAAPANSGALGQMRILEWNSNMRVSELVAPGVLFNATGYFNAQWWEGPSDILLPKQVDLISTDLEVGLFNDGPWSGQVAFHPQLVEGYEERITRRAFSFDGRAVTMYRASQNWSLVFGVAVWDRVQVLFVPHVGVIWTPNDRWELRVLYPKSRVSCYLGKCATADLWVYGSFEFTAEAWQTNIDSPPTATDRMQITEDQLSLGFRWDSGRYSFFVEGGYVFNRQTTFVGPTPGFSLGNVGMVRTGFRY